MKSSFAKTLIVANWKLYIKTQAEARALYKSCVMIASQLKRTEMVLAVPFVFVPHMAKRKNMHVGAQDVSWVVEGAYTGEVSARMLASVGATHVVAGHSERRDLAGDTDERVAQKVKAALGAGLWVILCVGERERATDGSSLAVVKRELLASLKGVSRTLAGRLIVAYEPIWAISAHHPKSVDTPESTLEMAIYIRKILHDLYGKATASRIRVLYGGSVTPENIRGFLERGGVDGALVGHASASARKFTHILHEAETSYSQDV